MPWHLGIATGCCADCSILDILGDIATTGAAGVELGTLPRHFDTSQPQQIEAVARRLHESSIDAVSIHAPFGGRLDLADPNPAHRQAAIDAILVAAGAIKHAGGRLVVVHPSDIERNGHDVAARLADVVRCLATLADRCGRDGLTVALESPLPHLIGGHPDEFAWVLDRVDASVRVCLDTGHTALGHSWHRFVEVAGSRLAHVHASDNHGHRDDHLPPGDGSIDWAEIVRTLEAATFTGWVMLELARPPGDAAAYLERAFHRASQLLKPTPERAKGPHP